MARMISVLSLKRGVVWICTAAVLVGMNGSALARDVRGVGRGLSRGGVRRSSGKAAVVAAVKTKGDANGATSEAADEKGFMPEKGLTPTIGPVDPFAGQKYHLRLHHLHTGETLDVVYKVGTVYLPGAIARLNYFLRDHRTQGESAYDPKEFDLLHSLMGRLRKPNGVIDIVCGYRSPETNAALRQNSPRTGVAEHSQHMEGHAIDIRVPGVSTVALRNAALSLRAGGVGYYPVSQFVHVDVGPVREWAFGRVPRRAGRRSRGSSVVAGM